MKTSRVEDVAELANEAYDLAMCPKGSQIEEEYGTRYSTGQTHEKIVFSLEIRKLIERCDRSGLLMAYLEKRTTAKDFKRCRRERCRHCEGSKCHRALDDDMMRLRQSLSKGGRN